MKEKLKIFGKSALIYTGIVLVVTYLINFDDFQHDYYGLSKGMSSQLGELFGTLLLSIPYYIALFFMRNRATILVVGAINIILVNLLFFLLLALGSLG